MQNNLKSTDDTWMPCINRFLKYVLTVKRSEKERIPKSEMRTAPFQHLLKNNHMEECDAMLDVKCWLPDHLCIVCVLKYKDYFQNAACIKKKITPRNSPLELLRHSHPTIQSLDRWCFLVRWKTICRDDQTTLRWVGTLRWPWRAEETAIVALWWKLHDKYSVLDSFRGYLSTLTLTRLIETWRPGGHAHVLKISDLLLNHLLDGWSSSEGKYRPLVREMHQKAQNVIDSFCTWWNINIPRHEKHIPLKPTLLNLCVLLFPSLCFSAYCNMRPNIFSHRGKHKQINWR